MVFGRPFSKTGKPFIWGLPPTERVYSDWEVFLNDKKRLCFYFRFGFLEISELAHLKEERQLDPLPWTLRQKREDSGVVVGDFGCSRHVSTTP